MFTGGFGAHRSSLAACSFPLKLADTPERTCLLRAAVALILVQKQFVFLAALWRNSFSLMAFRRGKTKEAKSLRFGKLAAARRVEF